MVAACFKFRTPATPASGDLHSQRATAAEAAVTASEAAVEAALEAALVASEAVLEAALACFDKSTTAPIAVEVAVILAVTALTTHARTALSAGSMLL